MIIKIGQLHLHNHLNSIHYVAMYISEKGQREQNIFIKQYNAYNLEWVCSCHLTNLSHMLHAIQCAPRYILCANLWK